MKYNILGCGWLGYPLALFLKQQGYAVGGSTRNDDKKSLFEENHISHHAIHIENNEIFGNLEALLDADVLCIAIPYSQQKNNRKAFEYLALKIGRSKVQKVIFISSTSVYKDTNTTISQTSSFVKNPQKKELIELEKMFLNQSGFKTTIVRFAGLIGGNRHPGNFFKEGRIVPNGLAPVNLIHLEDCLHILKIISEGNFVGEIFNAAADTHPSKKDFYTAASIKLGKNPAAFIEEKITFKNIDNTQLKKRLEYTFKHPDLLICLDAF
ncbi:MAG: hypothetical protein ACPHXR_02700 [Flavicella sp.]